MACCFTVCSECDHMAPNQILQVCPNCSSELLEYDVESDIDVDQDREYVGDYDD